MLRYGKGMFVLLPFMATTYIVLSMIQEIYFQYIFK